MKIFNTPGLVSVAVAVLPVAAGAQTKAPNIVMILVDDMGWSDIGCYGSEVSTPNLDRLAGQGMRFSQFYSNSRSCPTRASLMTGMYSAKAGVGFMAADHGVPEYQGYLRRDCATAAEVMKHNGYATYMAGKWHLGLEEGQRPSERGFDRSWVFWEGATDYYEPRGGICVDGRQVPVQKEGFYMTDAISDKAAEYIADAGKHSSPFFMYVAYTAPHWPLQAPKEVIDRYLERYAAGWDVIRTERFRRQLASGMLSAGSLLSPRPEKVPAWESLPEQEQREWQFKMAIYAAMVDIVDRGVGRIMEQLRAQGMDKNTVVMFASDNGACPHSVTWRPEKGAVAPGKGSTLHYGYPWANVSATPFRYYKRWTHEGGICVPFLVWYPPVVKAGTRCDVAAHVMDVLPTCVELCGGKFPDKLDGHKLNPCDGKSMLPLWKTGKGELHEAICWEHGGNRAVRQGDWKLVYNDDKEFRYWELYDLKEDRTELNDLSKKRPDKVKEMAAIYDAWAAKYRIIPFDQLKKMPQAKNRVGDD